MNLSKFQERLSELLFEKETNPPALAKELGCNRSTLNRYLFGSRMPSVEFVIRLADNFNCTTDFILGLEDENRAQEFLPVPPFKNRFPVVLEHFGVTRYRLAKDAEISESCIYTWQRSGKFPSLDSVVKIAEYLDCSVDFLLGRSKE